MTSTMQLGSLIFVSGVEVPGTSAGTLQLPDGSPQTVSAPLAVGTFPFAFWAVNLQVYPTQYSGGIADPQQVVHFTAPSEESFYASAWYLGGKATRPLESVVEAVAFSLNDNAVMPDSPFASVSPAGAQESPTSVSTATSDQAVIITAPGNIAGYGRFSQWLQISGNGTASGPVLTVPAGGTSLAVAFYADPCAAIRAEIGSIDSSDFPNFADYERVLRALEQQLRACEEEHGEL